MFYSDVPERTQTEKKGIVGGQSLNISKKKTWLYLRIVLIFGHRVSLGTGTFFSRYLSGRGHDHVG